MNVALLAALARLAILWKPCFVRLFIMRPAIGMKLDITSSTKSGPWVVACRAALIVAGMAGFVAGSQANESLGRLVGPPPPPLPRTPRRTPGPASGMFRWSPGKTPRHTGHY